MRHTVRWSLRHLRAVVPNIVDPAEQAFAARERRQLLQEGGDADKISGSKDENNIDGTTRLGGAKVLLPSTLNFYGSQENDVNPFHFVNCSPQYAGLCDPLCRELRQMDIKLLTELQAALIPVILKGRHAIAHAETGSGKSFGVALAVSNRILREVAAQRLHTLILVPTEELAQQYDRWFKHFCGAARHIVCAMSETSPLQPQLARLYNFPPHVLVGTPQGIAPVLRNAARLFGKKLRSYVDLIVLDEADIVLKMPVQQNSTDSAFETTRRYRDVLLRASPDTLPGKGQKKISPADLRVCSGGDIVDRVFRHGAHDIPAHIVALSATIDGATAKTLNSWMDTATAVRITTSIVEHSMPDSIRFFLFAAAGSKTSEFTPREVLKLVLRLIRAQHGEDQFKVLVLTNDDHSDVIRAVHEANDAVRHLRAASLDEPFRTCLISAADDENVAPSDGPSASSKAVGQSLRRGHRNIFAVDNTAVSRLTRGVDNVGIGSFSVARGLHIHGVTHVIIYGDAPSTTDLVHCAGRTGRAGDNGEVCIIFPPRCGRQLINTCHVVGVPWETNRLSALKTLVDAEESAASSDAEGRSRIIESVRESASGGNDRADMRAHRLHELRGAATSGTAFCASEEALVRATPVPSPKPAAETSLTAEDLWMM